MRRFTNEQIKLIEKGLCQHLREMTERNDHSGALLMLAERLNDITERQYTELHGRAENAYKWMQFISTEHERIGHLTTELHAFRTEVYHTIRTLTLTIYGEEIGRTIMGCL